MAIKEKPSPPADYPHEHQGPFRPSPAGLAGRAFVWALLAALVLWLPLTRQGFEAGLYARACIYAIIGLSLNVLIGYTGQVSLGHQAFVGIGAFASAYMATNKGQHFLIAVVVAMAVGGIQALLLGLVSLRVRGLYFALVTLSYGLLAERSLFKITTFTGGAAGQVAARPEGFASDHRYYYLCLMVLALVLWVDARMMKTKGGRALLALRENPRVAATFGVNVKVFTLFSFVVAGVFAGLGGALFAHYTEQVSAVTYNFQLAEVFIIMTVVGGLRSRAGVVIGSAFFALLSYLLDVSHIETILLQRIPFFPPLGKEQAELVLGPILLLLTLIMYPGGIGQQIRPIQQWLLGNRFNFHDRGLKEVHVSDVRA